MKRILIISKDEISELALSAGRELRGRDGAVITFLGIVRDLEEGHRIKGIEYEAFQEMVEHQFHKIFDAVETKWPISSVHLVHRIGFVAVDEPSLWVEVISPHRTEAFEACRFVIEEMKRVVPIWKKPQVVPHQGTS